MSHFNGSDHSRKVPTDETPDWLYIKVRPKRFRQIVQECGLTRTEAAELLFLALRINERNECFPSNQRCADDAGRRSPDQVRQLHKQLRRKGALQWKPDPEGRSHTFVLPDAFYFGPDSYQTRKSESGGTRKTILSGLGNPSPKINQSQQEESDRRSAIRADSLNEKVVNSVTTAQHQQTARQMLIQKGVFVKEADLLSQQFSLAEINLVLDKLAASRQPISNPGGWIRRSLENNAGKLLRYPNSNPKRLGRVQERVQEVTRQMLFPFADPDVALVPARDVLRDAVNTTSATQGRSFKRVLDILAGKDEIPAELMRRLALEPKCREMFAQLGIEVR